MSSSNSWAGKTLGLNGESSEAVGWWGHASSKTRITALVVALVSAVITFFVFRWLMQDDSVSYVLVSSIVAVLTALNVIQVWERSTIRGRE